MSTTTYSLTKKTISGTQELYESTATPISASADYTQAVIVDTDGKLTSGPILFADPAATDTLYIGSNSTVLAAGADECLAVGALSLDALTTGARNCAVGYESLSTLTTGIENTAVGQRAGYNTSASLQYGTMVGRAANCNGNWSTAIGRTSASGVYGVALGAQTTSSNSSSTALGYNSTASGNGSVVVGARSSATANYSITISGTDTGDTATTNSIAGRILIGDNNAAYQTSLMVPCVKSTPSAGLLTVNSSGVISGGPTSDLWGQIQLASGSATVSTTAVQSTSVIMLSRASVGGAGTGQLAIGVIVGGTQFGITSTDATDDSTVNWFIAGQAPS